MSFYYERIQIDHLEVVAEEGEGCICVLSLVKAVSNMRSYRRIPLVMKDGSGVIVVKTVRFDIVPAYVPDLAGSVPM